MSKIPAALEYAEGLMKVDLLKEFGIPEDNRRMGEALQEYLDRGGKYLRPGIIFSTVKTHNGDPVDPVIARMAALSLHYDHNFFLIHDDFEDGSRWRRGKPTMHILYGDDFAINYGDYLRTFAEMAMYRGLNVWGAKTYERMVEARQEMLRRTCEGQDLEFQLRKRPLCEMTEDKVKAILVNKTAIYTIVTPVRYASIIAGLPSEQIEPHTPYLIKIGIAFQCIDDVLGLTVPKEEERGDATLIIKKFGKDWAGDLEEGKRTLLLQKLHSRATADDQTYLRKNLDINGNMGRLVRKRDMLREQTGNRWMSMMKRLSTDTQLGAHMRELKKNERDIDEIKLRTIEMMNSYRVITDVRDYAQKLYSDNVLPVERALPDGEGKKELLELLNFAVFRTF
jgi:geranylgeranyl pyrophosphate synthase